MNFDHLRSFGIKSIQVVNSLPAKELFHRNNTLSNRPEFYVFLSKSDYKKCQIYIPNIDIEYARQIENEYLFGHFKYE